MKKIISLTSLLLCFTCVFSQENPLWLRYPAISPDGNTIVFSYQGDLYKISSSGGQAIPLTLHEAYDANPVWSHDGKWIAFNSDRYGNFDIYVMPSAGGEAKRLTYYSGTDMPWDFTPDNKSVLFTSQRIDLVTNAQIPGANMNELYAVPLQGGRASQVITHPAINAQFNSAGDKIIFHDYKGYEDNWRKHHTSSVTRDLWVYDLKTKKYEQLTSFEGEDRNPVFHSNNNDYYFLSEANGSFNIFKSSLAKTQPTAITKFTKHPVRFLTISDNNTLCFTYDGEIYTIKEGESPKKVKVSIMLDGRSNQEKILPVNAGITEMSASPNGKEVVFIVRGEVFVSSVEGGITKRITNTSTQERTASFSPDGRTIIYAAERNNNWNIYTASIVRKEESYFYASTLIKEEPLIATEKEEFQPLYSPDGKEVAYLEERANIRVYNMADKKSRTIVPADKNYSYADGDLGFDWSPDGKWITTSYMTGLGFIRDIGIIPSDGKGQLTNLTQSGFNDVRPEFSKDGKMIFWYSDRDGNRALNTQSTSGDIYGLFLTQEALDRYRLSKEDFTLTKEQEEKDKKKDTTKTAVKEDKTVKIEWEGINDRKVRLTTHTSSLSDAVINSTNDKLYYLARFESGADLWSTDLRTKETKLVTKLDAGQAAMELSKDGKALFIVSNGRIIKMDPESGKRDNVNINGEMNHDAAGERSYIFEHAWRQVKKKFYVQDLHGVDWSSYYNEYKKFLPYIRNNYDFSDMLGEMLGELNASHTGARFAPPQVNTDATAALGIFYDHDHKGKGLKILEVVDKGPLDKATSKIRAGHIIEAIDGEELPADKDFYMFLNRKAGKFTLLSVYDPQTNTRWDETVKPITLGEESELLYQRWVENRRKETERLSGGKIGYVHVRGMNDPSMRVVIDEVLGKNLDKEAIVVDTRFNGGGNLHEQLSDFLSGKKYFDIIPHGQQIGYQPQTKWIKPSIVLVGESNYSDAHLFPLAYKLKNLGQTIGMPVPGTGTFVWWETQIDPTLVFGIPQGGWRTPDGKFAENTQLDPDIRVKNDPALMAIGRDLQLERAVQELQKTLGKKI